MIRKHYLCLCGAKYHKYGPSVAAQYTMLKEASTLLELNLIYIVTIVFG